MKKIILITFSFFSLAIHAQVFNTAGTLKKNTFSFGLEPAILVYNGGNDFMMFFHGGYGIKSGIDLGIHVGAGNSTYFGAELEWGLGKHFSLTTGAHNFGDFGLDGALNASFDITSGVDLFTGLDMDIIFAKNKTYVPLWLPLGVEIGIGSSMSFILETEIVLTDNAYHVIGGGVSFYF
jgi:hypothetical protein